MRQALGGNAKGESCGGSSRSKEAACDAAQLKSPAFANSSRQDCFRPTLLRPIGRGRRPALFSIALNRRCEEGSDEAIRKLSGALRSRGLFAHGLRPVRRNDLAFRRDRKAR